MKIACPCHWRLAAVKAPGLPWSTWVGSRNGSGQLWSSYLSNDKGFFTGKNRGVMEFVKVNEVAGSLRS